MYKYVDTLLLFFRILFRSMVSEYDPTYFLWAANQMCMLDVVFGDDIVAAGCLSTNIGSLPFKVSGNAPRQPSGVDCGVFVIRNMQCYGSDWAGKVSLKYEQPRRP